MHTFWLVPTYDLLEDRCIDDVIIKFDCLFRDKRRLIQVWQLGDSLNQSQFFAKHRNQSVCFILYRQ